MIRYHKLGYVELNVSDLARAREFYRDMVGLEYLGPHGATERFRCDPEEPYSVVLHESAAPGFKRAGWILENAAQFAVLQDRLDAASCPWEELDAAECDDRGFLRALRMVERHTGATLEFYRPAGERPVRPLQASHTSFQRLGHVVFATPERADAVAFFRDVLNFKESDAVGEYITFMRPFPSPWHHGIGIGRSARRQFHHLNLMVSEIDDIGRGLNRAGRSGVPVVFGPGRHIASNSVFLYFLDPDGTTLEYSFGMEEFPEVDAREPRRLPPGPESLDSWGAVRQPGMAEKGEIELAVIRATRTGGGARHD
jgi:2,3-dihydroxy-p-cumate/2,3-dihydroxybenzoate 3,4-dioxygenase